MTTTYNSRCTLCPRNCAVDRENKLGFCGVHKEYSRVARVALHMWEEPIISGQRGSGTIFFCGCNLRCVFCQNNEISTNADFGALCTASDLAMHMLALEKDGAHNINLVTPTPHVYNIISAVKIARNMGLSIPIAYNTNSYMDSETVRLLKGTVDIYMPDFKYITPRLSEDYSCAPDYFYHASKAISEMLNQCGDVVTGTDGTATRGVIIRHLVLPANIDETRRVLDYIAANFGTGVTLSLMSQYFPAGKALHMPPLDRKLTKAEYSRATDYALSLGFSNIWTQSLKSATQEYVPQWNMFS